MNNARKNREYSRSTIIFMTLVIVLLVLGYIPLGILLDRQDMVVQYELNLGKQYDVPGENMTPVEAFDVAQLEGNRGMIFTGLPLERRYTELIVDAQGVDPARIEVTAEYLGDPQQLWMHLGGLYDKAAYSIPLDIAPLQDGNWLITDEGDFSLYQREQRFSGTEQLFSSTAAESEDIALAGISPGDAYSLFLQGKRCQVRELLGMPIRGEHELELIVNTGSLHMEIMKRDLNRTTGSDDVNVTLKKGGSTIYSGIIPDDGNVYEDAIISAEEIGVSTDLDNLEKGSYTLTIEPRLGGDDFIISSIITDAPKAVIKDNVFLFDPRETGPEQIIPAIEAMTIYLDSPPGILTARTWHPIVRRTISLGATDLLTLKAAGPGAPFQSGSVTLEGGEKELRLGNPGSIILQYLGGGFSFSRDAVFNPSYPRFKPIIGMQTIDTPLALTRFYRPPSTEGSVKKFTRSLPLEGISFPGGKIKIILEKTGEGEVYLTHLRLFMVE
ncbi:MAG: hypothetical protein HPY75_00460 [Actinobacteria bacterium]|nr:hypothetical protein [Actinomycetota bacterium]